MNRPAKRFAAIGTTLAILAGVGYFALTSKPAVAPITKSFASLKKAQILNQGFGTTLVGQGPRNNRRQVLRGLRITQLVVEGSYDPFSRQICKEAGIHYDMSDLGSGSQREGTFIGNGIVIDIAERGKQLEILITDQCPPTPLDHIKSFFMPR